jgi:FKBP-type peptidyl-prolyl cis-trans isomerase FkpA
MKQIVLSLAIVASFFISSGCLKDGSSSYTCTATIPPVTVPDTEVQAIESYLVSKSITNTTKHPKGFYYIIETAGTGNQPTLCSNVAIYYKGYLTNDTVFDQTGNTPAVFQLANLIQGWQYGLPLIKAGGKIKLFLPPSLAYGNRALPGIPANSILIFEITLVGV